MIKTVAATFECDVCQKLALSAGEGGFTIPEGWISVELMVMMRVPTAPGRGASAEGHVCSSECLAKLFAARILIPLNTPPQSPEEDSNT